MASGSEVTQRLEDWRVRQDDADLGALAVQCAAPPEEVVLARGAEPPAGAVQLVSVFLLEEHALTASVAAAPTTRRPSALLRMGTAAFREMRRRWLACGDQLNVVGGNISLN